MRWTIVLTKIAQEMLADISDRRLREKIADRIDGLKEHPDQQGKPLSGNLNGLRSLRAAGQRYQIIYCLNKNQIIVVVVAIGIRSDGSKKDIYELALRLVRLGLIDPKK